MTLGVDGGLEVEVELLDGAPGREVSEAQPGVQAVVGGWRRPPRRRARPGTRGGHRRCVTVGEAGEHLGGAVQLEVAEVVLDRFDQRRRAHQPPPKHSQPEKPGSVWPSEARSESRWSSGCGPIEPNRSRSGLVDVVVAVTELEHRRRLDGADRRCRRRDAGGVRDGRGRSLRRRRGARAATAAPTRPRRAGARRRARPARRISSIGADDGLAGLDRRWPTASGGTE